MSPRRLSRVPVTSPPRRPTHRCPAIVVSPVLVRKVCGLAALDAVQCALRSLSLATSMRDMPSECPATSKEVAPCVLGTTALGSANWSCFFSVFSLFSFSVEIMFFACFSREKQRTNRQKTGKQQKLVVLSVVRFSTYHSVSERRDLISALLKTGPRDLVWGPSASAVGRCGVWRARNPMGSGERGPREAFGPQGRAIPGLVARQIWCGRPVF